nr:hypothetical protein [Calditerricola satsumensis]
MNRRSPLAKRAKPVRNAELADVTLTNPDKLLWPEEGITKRDYLAYLFAVAKPLLAYTRNRALTVIRYPDGVHGESFYQKNAPSYAPPWIPRRQVGDVDAILLNDLRTLLWLGNQAALEFHVPFHEVDDPDHPLELTFDLDPSVPGFAAVVETALRLKEVTDRLGLPTYVKTSGATGLAVYIPLERRYTYAETRRWPPFWPATLPSGTRASSPSRGASAIAAPRSTSTTSSTAKAAPSPHRIRRAAAPRPPYRRR